MVARPTFQPAQYTRWPLSICTNQQTEPESMVTTEAIDLLASQLHPLQLGGTGARLRLPRQSPETMLTSHGYRFTRPGSDV